jgi:hypothetical protein
VLGQWKKIAKARTIPLRDERLRPRAVFGRRRSHANAGIEFAYRARHALQTEHWASVMPAKLAETLHRSLHSGSSIW